MIRFRDLRGQSRAIESLQRAVAQERPHHAYLFAGPRGVGKRAAASAYASLILCRAPADGDACGTCRSCVKMRGGSHPDAVVVEPDGRFIKIGQVRELRSKTKFRPYEGDARVVIIDEADRMNEEAANALLKTLEEPGGETLLVLVTAQPHLLLTTIRSRCQLVRFGPLPEDDVAALLRARGITGEQATSSARTAGGSIGRALEIIESPVFAERAEIAHQLSRGPQLTDGELLDWAEELGQRRDRLVETLELFASLFRDAIMVARGMSDDRLLHPDLRPETEALSERLDETALLAFVDRISVATRQLEGNVNTRLVLERLMLEFAAQRQRDRQEKTA